LLDLWAILCDRDLKSRKIDMTMIEKNIGEKIKEFRKQQGISQIELAERVGLSFQQIQKYEKGITKISVSRLLQIAKALNVDICAFFEGYKENHYVMEKKQDYPATPSLKEERDLIHLFRTIHDDTVKQGILLLLKGIVEIQNKNR